MTDDLSFEHIEQLRDRTARLLSAVPASLIHYYDKESCGYFHVMEQDAPKEEPNEAGHFSKASTATTLLLLDDRGDILPYLPKEDDWESKAAHLATAIVNSNWDSAGIGPGNVFTTSHLLQA